MALQQVEHHAVAGCELTDEGISRACGQLSRLSHPFKTTLHRHHIALGIKAPPTGTTGHLQEFAGHQRPVAPLGALGECGNHGAARRHVDPGRQGFRGEHDLHQPLLEQFFNQLFPRWQHPSMVSRDAPQERISMQAIAHGFGIGRCVGLETFTDACLLRLVDQTLHPEIAHGLVTPSATENEIDRRQHLPFSHLSHDETDWRRLWLRRAL